MCAQNVDTSSELLIAPCNYRAARYAVTNWHYSQAMPAAKLVLFGVWERKQYIGCIMFGRGANAQLGKPYGLEQTELCELVRVALDKHRAPVTRIVAIALRQLKRLNPDLRLVVSFADPMQGHLGGIYQAGNWLYLGESMPDCRIQCRGKIHHPRSIGSIYGTRDINWLRKNVDPKAKKLADTGKFRYVYPLDRLIRKQLMAKTKPYPTELLQLGAESIAENTPNAA